MQAKLTSKYGTRDEIMLATFHVDTHLAYSSNEKDCYFGDYPTLGMLNFGYGSKTAQEWLTYALADLSEFSGARDKITPEQLAQLADIIATDYHWLKVTEIMLFLRKFKRGCYGKFYGAVDPITITQALQEFTRDRMVVLARHEQEEREAREAEERRLHPPITWDEWLAIKKKKQQTIKPEQGQ